MSTGIRTADDAKQVIKVVGVDKFHWGILVVGEREGLETVVPLAIGHWKKTESEYKLEDQYLRKDEEVEGGDEKKDEEEVAPWTLKKLKGKKGHMHKCSSKEEAIASYNIFCAAMEKHLDDEDRCGWGLVDVWYYKKTNTTWCPKPVLIKFCPDRLSPKEKMKATGTHGAITNECSQYKAWEVNSLGDLQNYDNLSEHLNRST